MIKRIFWNGVKAFVPVALTLAIVVWLFRTVETFFKALMLSVFEPKFYFDGLGIILGIVFIFVVGILVNAWLIKQIYKMGESWVKKIPGIKTIYNSIQDLLSFFDKSQQEGQRAVVVNTPLGNLVGFVTRESFEDLPSELGNEQNVLVYMPMSYQIGGYTLSVPRSQVKPLDMSVNDAMSLVITGGMGSSKSE